MGRSRAPDGGRASSSCAPRPLGPAAAFAVVRRRALLSREPVEQPAEHVVLRDGRVPERVFLGQREDVGHGDHGLGSVVFTRMRQRVTMRPRSGPVRSSRLVPALMLSGGRVTVGSPCCTRWRRWALGRALTVLRHSQPRQRPDPLPRASVRGPLRSRTEAQ